MDLQGFGERGFCLFLCWILKEMARPRHLSPCRARLRRRLWGSLAKRNVTPVARRVGWRKFLGFEGCAKRQHAVHVSLAGVGDAHRCEGAVLDRDVEHVLPAGFEHFERRGKFVSCSGRATEKPEPTLNPLSARKGMATRSVSYGEMATDALVDAETTEPMYVMMPPRFALVPG